MRIARYACAIICLLVVGGICAEESFVKQPKKRHSGQGLSTVREFVGTEFANFVGHVPELLHDIANFQALNFNCVSEFIQGDKKGLIARANETNLNKLKEVCERCNKARQALGDELKKATTIIRDMVKEYSIECRS